MYNGINGKKILIACSMIEDEINAVFDLNNVTDIEIWWQERGHHNYPDKLRDVIQAEIDRAEEAGADVIMLGYGLCGKGAAGLSSERAVLAVPRFDDCINMMLCTGRRDRRNYLEAGNMYLTGGWIKDEGALLSMLESYLSKYGERKAKKLMKMMLGSYTNVTVVDTGCFDMDAVQAYADECVRELGLTKKTVPGSIQIFEKLILGNWDEDILVKQPGEPVKENDFCFGD